MQSREIKDAFIGNGAMARMEDGFRSTPNAFS